MAKTKTITTGTTALLYRLLPLSSKIKIHDNENNGNNYIVVKVVPVVAQNKNIRQREQREQLHGSKGCPRCRPK